MQQKQSGFAKLMLACAGLVREVRLSIEEQQADAARREQVLRDENERLRIKQTVLPMPTVIQPMEAAMGITLLEVQQKVILAIQKRDALRKQADALHEYPEDFVAVCYNTMDRCLVALRSISADVIALQNHIKTHSVAANKEQEIRALIKELEV